MIALQSDVRVYLACGYTYTRKGMQGLAMLVQQVLAEDPLLEGLRNGSRGRRLVKALIIIAAAIGADYAVAMMNETITSIPLASTVATRRNSLAT